MNTICQVIGLAPSSYYYQPSPSDTAELEAALLEKAAEWPLYGSRRLTEELRRAEWIVSRKRVQRLMRKLRLVRRTPRRKIFTTNSRHGFPRYPNLLENLVIREPDEVWVADLTYIRLGQGFVFLAVIMDVFTRTIRGWHLSRDANTELTLIALQRALQDHVPQIHHSDQGVQYAADVYTKLLDSHEVQISMAAVGAPEENGYAERLIRTLKEEEVDLSDYRDFADAYQQIGHFIQEVYNRKRIHSSLGYLTPLEFETAFSSGSAHATAAPAGAD